MSSTPTQADLVWNGNLEFTANLSNHTIVLDSSSAAGPSPTEMLGAAIAGCMSIDLVHILQRGRHELRSLRAKLVAERAAEVPRCFRVVTLHFTIEGSMSRDAVERAIELSRTKYCSVWLSMRQDIDLQVTFDLAS